MDIKINEKKLEDLDLCMLKNIRSLITDEIRDKEGVIPRYFRKSERTPKVYPRLKRLCRTEIINILKEANEPLLRKEIYAQSNKSLCFSTFTRVINSLIKENLVHPTPTPNHKIMLDSNPFIPPETDLNLRLTEISVPPKDQLSEINVETLRGNPYKHLILNNYHKWQEKVRKEDKKQAINEERRVLNFLRPTLCKEKQREYYLNSKKKGKERVKKGFCFNCGEERKKWKFYCDVCQEKSNLNTKLYRLRKNGKTN